MKKIMFNDKYGLTEAVLDGRKTMTRRIIPIGLHNSTDWGAVESGDYIAVENGDGDFIDIRNCGNYSVGEVVAIAQSYEDIYAETDIRGAKELDEWFDKIEQAHNGKDYCLLAGTDNKMFVKAELMLHHIRITNIKVERLQDISDEDCLNEGIEVTNVYEVYGTPESYVFDNHPQTYYTPRDAFAALINKVSGKGTWENNPWVFVYSFEVVD